MPSSSATALKELQDQAKRLIEVKRILAEAVEEVKDYNIFVCIE